MSFAPAQRVHTYSTYERFYCRSALRLWNCNSCFWPTTLMCIASEHRSNLCQLMGLICDWSERSSALQPVISPHCREQKHVDYKEMASLILLATKQRTFWKEKFGRFRLHAIFIKINDFYNVRWEQKKWCACGLSAGPEDSNKTHLSFALESFHLEVTEGVWHFLKHQRERKKWKEQVGYPGYSVWVPIKFECGPILEQLADIKLII